jgi:hypothetical protein
MNRWRRLEVLTKRRLHLQTRTPEDNGRTPICICEAMCQGEYYSCHDGVFRLNMTGCFRVVRLTLDIEFMSLKLQELIYLRNIFYIIRNLLTLYTDTLPDVMSYVLAEQSFIEYIEPVSNASKHILFRQILEEFKILCKTKPCSIFCICCF